MARPTTIPKTPEMAKYIVSAVEIIPLDQP